MNKSKSRENIGDDMRVVCNDCLIDVELREGWQGPTFFDSDGNVECAECGKVIPKSQPAFVIPK